MAIFNPFSTLMPRLGLLAVLGLAAGPIQAQTPTWASVQRSTSAGPNSGANGQHIAVAADGSQYITGSFEGTLTLGTFTLTGAAGIGHLYVAKLSTTGTVLWAHKLEAATSGDLFGNVAVDAQGNAYMTGYFSDGITIGSTTLTSPGDDSFLVKYDPQGVQQWVRQGGADGTYAQAIGTDASGNVTIAGDYSGSVSFGGTPLTGSGLFMYKLSPAGTVLQARQIGNDGLANDLAIDGAGNTYVVGSFGFGAGPSTMFGTTTLTSAGNLDMFLVKLDAQGNHVWAQRAGSVEDDAARSVAVDAGGNPLVGGYYESMSTATTESSSIYLARYSTQGALLWTRQVTPSVPDAYAAEDVAYDGRGGFYVTGGFQGTVAFGATTLSTTGESGLYVARYNNQGTAVWADRPLHTGASAASIGQGIATDASGNAYVVGAARGSVRFGTLPASTGGLGAIVAKLNAGGVLANSRPAAALALRAYPNPATGVTTLELPVGGGHLVLADALGRPVREQALPHVAGPCAVSLAGLAPGIYQLRATLANGQAAYAQVAVQ